MFQFAQGTLRGMGPIEQECLASLADLGFRFSLDQMTDLRIEPRELGERGFRFVKVPARLLLSRVAAPQGDIHPADFSDLLGRFGIDLIAERIESEGMVVDLLDYDVRFGQGTLFSAAAPGARRGAARHRRAPARARSAAGARRRAPGADGRGAAPRAEARRTRAARPPSRRSRAGSCAAHKASAPRTRGFK